MTLHNPARSRGGSRYNGVGGLRSQHRWRLFGVKKGMAEMRCVEKGPNFETIQRETSATTANTPAVLFVPFKAWRNLVRSLSGSGVK
jgi:hypothetical protein